MLDILLKTAYLSAISLSLYTSGWLLIKADKSRTTGALVACQLLIIIWCIPQLFSSLPATKGIKYLAYGISYVGISFIGPAWLEFAFLYSRRRLGALVRIALFGISAVNYSFLLTNELHHLFYTIFEAGQVVYGPVFYIHMAYTYICVLSGMAVVLAAFRKNQVEQAHITIILLSAAAPLGFNLLYMTGLVKSGFDLTPPAFALSSVLMLLAVFRYDFLDINVLAFDRIFDSIAEGVVVYDRKGMVRYCNNAAASWFRLKAGDRVDGLSKCLEEHGVILKAGGSGPVPVMDFCAGGNQWKLEVKQYACQNRKGEIVARAFMFTDVGKYYQLLEQGRELALSNQKLAIEQERNRIAQEVHDTTGHTLTMINSLLKLIRIEYEKGDGSGAPDYLKQAQELAGGGIRELRCSINNLRQSLSHGLITQGVYQLARSVKEFEVEVEIQGEDKEAYSPLSEVIYECLREAITNCLKYASASRMDVILKFGRDCLNLYIFDNGAGCHEIQEGNGIRGIRQRTETSGGTVRFISGYGEGFQIYISLPLPTGPGKGRADGGNESSGRP